MVFPYAPNVAWNSDDTMALAVVALPTVMLKNIWNTTMATLRQQKEQMTSSVRWPLHREPNRTKRMKSIRII